MGIGKNIAKKTKRFLLHSYNSLTDKKAKVLVLVYHRVLESARFNPLNNIVSLPRFIQQIEKIIKRYLVVSLADIIQQCRLGEFKAKTQVVLTFDDGYSDNYEFAFPILQKKSLPAAFFLTTDYVSSNSPLWDWQLINILSNNTSIRGVEVEDRMIRQGFFESRLSFVFRILDKTKPLSFTARHKIISALAKETKNS